MNSVLGSLEEQESLLQLSHLSSDTCLVDGDRVSHWDLELMIWPGWWQVCLSDSLVSPSTVLG